MTATTRGHGPHHIHVTPLPGGVALDITSVLERFATDLLDRLGELQEIAEESDERHRTTLLQALVDELGTTVPVYGRDCLDFADRIRQVASPRVYPQARRGGEEAAA